MSFPVVTVWREALNSKRFRIHLFLSVFFLLVCAFTAPILFQFIQKRQGFILNDYLLDWLPAFDLSLWTFVLLYFLIFLGVLSLLTHPHQFLITLQAYILLTVFRFLTILLVPLEPPKNIIELIDPFVQHLFYQQSVTKDLFFSGHTSLLVLLTLAVPSSKIRIVLFTGTFLIASMLLIQHAHYTVDVVLAPLFSWMAFVTVKKFSIKKAQSLH
jgi:hypothetical protein